MTDKSAPAFPTGVAVGPAGDIYQSQYDGMTIRQYAAIAAMQGITAFTGTYGLGGVDGIATRAVELADALLAELDKAGAE